MNEIVKVEIGREEDVPLVARIRNETGDKVFSFAATSPLRARMLGLKKRFFLASIDGDCVDLLDPVSDQSW
jgi:hypothetical protein